MSGATPWQKETEYRLEKSDTPVDVDGYKIGEPKELVCADCGATVQLTEEPSAGIDDLEHSPTCSNRFAKSDWWRSQL
jgi:hypothetical protein